MDTSTIFSDLLHLVYPQVCAACERALFRHERAICMYCRQHLPLTGFHRQYDNPVVRMFWGRVLVQAAASCFFYKKGNHVQKLIHRLKYKGEQEIGNEIGLIYGRELKNSPVYDQVTRIVPVPLHAARLRSRGFNQSECFAVGLSEAMSVPLEKDLLKRSGNKGSQTKRSRYSRWESVEKNFLLNEKTGFENEHFLLVDDVITTGATLEACAARLISLNGCQVSIATIASTFN